MGVPRHQRTTIKDVAARAGVSYQTVSRVLNGKDDVSDKTRERVRAAIDELNYRPSAIARSLVSQRTHVLGLFTADFSDYTHARIIEGAEAEARHQGYLIFVSGGDRGPDGEPLSSPLLSQHQTEGLLIVYHGSDRDTGALFEHVSPELPVVTIGYGRDLPRVVSVGIANVQGGYLATEHLLALGRRRIALISGPRQFYASQERYAGYAQALAQANRQVDQRLVDAGDWTSASGYAAMLRLLDRASFDAVFVQNDRMAMGALQALRERGRRVPDDIAVVGFDDIPSTPYFDPHLTTVHQPNFELGQAAAQILIDIIHGAPPPVAPIRLTTHLVIRQSCGAAPAAKGGDTQDVLTHHTQEVGS
ncbi:MAG: LacI family DNA-binding transcriptional regulator [Anaerolineae bacterium]